MKRDKMNLIFLFLCLAIIFMVAGCSKKPLKGEPVPNKPPQLNLANIPPDSTIFTASPVLSWYATDVDGDVWEYCYADIPRTRFPQQYLTFYANPSTIPDSLWHCSDKTSDTLFFSLEPGDTITEHLFCVRARDNNGAYSNYNCRIYFRTNRPPVVHITTSITEIDTFWCLAETTANWGGINITWDAEDPDNSIKFEYYWYVLDAARDTVRHSVGWISQKNVRLTGIPTGHYFFYVRVRDDAYEPSILPDSIPLNVVKPYFDWTDESINFGSLPKNVLLVNETSTGLGDPRPTMLGEVEAFYTGALEQLKQEGIIDNYTIFNITGPLDVPSKLLLSQNLIVYWFSVDRASGMSDRQAQAISEYLDIGGRLLLESRAIQDAAQSFLMNYLGIYNVQPDSGMQGSRRDYYFREAIPSIDGYPRLEVDSIRAYQILLCIGTAFLPTLPSVVALRTLPNVYNTPIKYVETIYRYGVASFDSTSPRYPLSLILNNLPVGVRFVNRDTRTVTFSFPTLLMVNTDGQAVDAIRKSMIFLTRRRGEASF